MKKLFFILLAGAISLSCSSDDSSGPTFSDTAEAKIEFDNSNFGIYKGVFGGSSGNVHININNEGSLSATLVVDGTTYNYTTAENATLGTTIDGLTFTNGSSSFDFNVGADGLNPTVDNIVLSGHPTARILILKEFSDTPIMIFEGTFGGADMGYFNVVFRENEIGGIARSYEDYGVSGVRTGMTFHGNYGNANTEGEFTGTIDPNFVMIYGNWNNTDDESGSFSGGRTL